MTPEEEETAQSSAYAWKVEFMRNKMHPYSFHDPTVAAGLQSCHFTALVQSQCSHICLQEAAATYTTYYCHQQAARQINWVINIVEHLAAPKKAIWTINYVSVNVHFDT